MTSMEPIGRELLAILRELMPVGTPVRVETFEGAAYDTVTCSEPFLVGYSPHVRLDGISRSYPCYRVIPWEQGGVA